MFTDAVYEHKLCTVLFFFKSFLIILTKMIMCVFNMWFKETGEQVNLAGLIGMELL